MRKQFTIASCFVVTGIAALIACNQQTGTENSASSNSDSAASSKTQYGSTFESQVKWGEHLVTIAGCNDCHTPKKMGPQGPEPDMSLMLSGHPAQMPIPPVDRKAAE